MRCDACGHEQSSGSFCGYCGAPIQSESSASVPSSTDERWAFLTAGTGRLVFALVLVVLVLGGGTLLVTGRDGSGGSVTLPSPGEIEDATDGPASRFPDTSPSEADVIDVDFDTATGTVLVFDDGRDGAVAVDLDSGRRVEFRLPGQGPGDQPFRLSRMGSWLVYGWGTIWAAAPGSDLPVRQLGTATIFVPGAEPGQLWFIDYPGGRIGQGTPTWTLVDASGQPLHQGEGEDGMYAVRGVPGGLAVRGEDGRLRRYGVATGQIEDYLGDEDARIGDVAADRVVWCERACERLHVTDGGGREVGVVDGPQVESFDPDAMWLSGGADRLAVHARVRKGSGVTFELQIYDLGTDRLVAATTVPLGDVRGAWTLDGRQFFYRTQPGASAPDRLRILGRYSAGTFEGVPFDRDAAPEFGFVALPDEALRGLLR